MYQYASKGKTQSEGLKSDTSTANKNHAKAGIKTPMQLMSQRLSSPLQLRLRPKQENSEAQLFPMMRSEEQARLAPRSAQSNNTGIPLQMKEKFENLSGFSFDDVKVHYNSDKPAQLQALAYTQGNQVHIAPGQEKHLGHELGHVVQQKQGLVKPTTRINNSWVNSDSMLESDADNLGKLSYKRHAPTHFEIRQLHTNMPSFVVQRALEDWIDDDYRYIQILSSTFSSLLSRHIAEGNDREKVFKTYKREDFETFIKDVAGCDANDHNNVNILKAKAKIMVTRLKSAVPTLDIDPNERQTLKSHTSVFKTLYDRTAALNPAIHKVYLGSMRDIKAKRPALTPPGGRPEERIDATLWDLDINRAYMGGAIDRGMMIKVLSSGDILTRHPELFGLLNGNNVEALKTFVAENQVSMLYDQNKPHKYTALFSEIIQLMNHGYLFRVLRHNILYAFKNYDSLNAYLRNKAGRA